MKIKILLLLATIALLSACDSERYYFLWRYSDSDQYTFDGFFKVPETEYFARLMDTTEFRFKYLYLSKDSLLLRNNVHDDDVICIKTRKLYESLSFVEFHEDVIVIYDIAMSVIKDRKNICCRSSGSVMSEGELTSNILIASVNNKVYSNIKKKDSPHYTQCINWVYTDTQILSESFDKRKDPRNKLLRYQYRRMTIRQFLSRRFGYLKTKTDKYPILWVFRIAYEILFVL